MRSCFRGWLYLLLISYSTISAAQPGSNATPQLSWVAKTWPLFEARASAEYSPVVDISTLAWQEREQLYSKITALHKDKKSRFYMALLMALKNR